ncbi:MAG: helix-turn-helix domain-containing protein [Pseudonocardiaceae bacterium]
MVGRRAADRGRDVRLQLLSTAAQLITELGWAAVSTRILAERAGVTPGLVHYHFTSLQARCCSRRLISQRPAMRRCAVSSLA